MPSAYNKPVPENYLLRRIGIKGASLHKCTHSTTDNIGRFLILEAVHILEIRWDTLKVTSRGQIIKKIAHDGLIQYSRPFKIKESLIDPGLLLNLAVINIHKILDSTNSSNNMLFCLESEFYLPKRGCNALFSLEKRWICGDKCIFRVETFQALCHVANFTNAGFGEVRNNAYNHL